MNYFSNKKIYVWALIVLVLLNIFSLSALFIQYKRTAIFEATNNRQDRMQPRIDRIERFMKKEIGFSETQIDSFRTSRKANIAAMQELNMKVHKRKKQLMDGTFDGTIDEIESKKLIRELGDLQIEIEEMSLKHLKEMNRLCQPGQKEKLKRLLEEAMIKHRPKFHNRENGPRKDKSNKKGAWKRRQQKQE